MERRDPTYREAVPATELPLELEEAAVDDLHAYRGTAEHHATFGGSAIAGAVKGGVIGTAAGPVGTAVGAVGGAIVGAIAERVMHHDNPERQQSRDDGPEIEDGTLETHEEHILGDDVNSGVRRGLDQERVTVPDIERERYADAAGVPTHDHTFVAGYCTCGARQP